MITLINNDGDQPMSLEDRDSYYDDFETNNLPKAEKGKAGDTHFDDLFALLKNSANNNNNNNNNNNDNNNNGTAVGEKRPITKNDGGANAPANVPCCQNPAKTISDDEVELEILNQVDQKHQTPQNLGDAISERLASVIKEHCSYEPEKFDNIKKLNE